MPISSQFNELRDAVVYLGLPAGTRILLAVSGGPDSVGLFHAFTALAPERAWALRVGHVNHQIRDSEAEEDERFVQALGAEHGIKVENVRVSTREHAGAQHLSLETAARELRHKALEQMLADWQGDLIATGHTLDDQAETVLLHLLRGAGLAGLGGMRQRSDHLVRPFLQLRHQTIVDALQERGLPYRIDTSNQDSRFLRNRLRHEAMPMLRTIRPQVDQMLVRSARLLAADYDFIEGEAGRAYARLDVVREGECLSASTAVWRALHPTLQTHTIRILLAELLGSLYDIDEAHINRIAAVIRSGEVARLEGQLPHGLALETERERFILRRGKAPEPVRWEPAILPVPGVLDIGPGKVVASDRLERGPDTARLLTVCGPLVAICDADRLSTALQVRPRRPGDRMRPLGTGGSRKIKEIMIDRRVPRHLRDAVPIVESDQNIVWVPGLALDDRVKVTDSTRQYVRLQFHPKVKEAW